MSQLNKLHFSSQSFCDFFSSLRSETDVFAPGFFVAASPTKISVVSFLQHYESISLLWFYNCEKYIDLGLLTFKSKICEGTLDTSRIKIIFTHLRGV